jgi:hypothetical protein
MLLGPGLIPKAQDNGFRVRSSLILVLDPGIPSFFRRFTLSSSGFYGFAVTGYGGAGFACNFSASPPACDSSSSYPVRRPKE